MNSIVRVFVNIHMGLSHDGLKELMRRHKCEAPESIGEHVVFINRARNHVKMYSARNIIHYLKLQDGEKLRMESIQYFPQCFTEGSGIDYKKALHKSVEDFLISKKKATDSRVVLQ